MIFHTLFHNSADMLRHCFRSSCNKRGNSDLLQPRTASVHTDRLIIEMDFLSITGAHKHMHTIFFFVREALISLPRFEEIVSPRLNFKQLMNTRIHFAPYLITFDHYTISSA